MSELDFNADMNVVGNVVPIAVAAWERVKAPNQPSFFGCAAPFQFDLLAHAKSALQTGAQSGDTVHARLEQAVVALRAEANAPQVEVGEAVPEPTVEPAPPVAPKKTSAKSNGKKSAKEK